MADKIPDLHATVRAGTGKGAARAARRAGDVPGIVYGGGADPLPINLNFDKLLTRLRKGGFMSTLYNLKVEGHDDVRVICRGVQRHVVKDLPTHIDLMRLKRTTRVKLMIPVNFLNQDTCPGIKKGGVLTVVRPVVELEVLAGDIPDAIDVELGEAQIGDTLSISGVTLPEGAKPTVDRDFVIANIQPPKNSIADDEDAAEEGGEEAAEGGAEEEAAEE